jgi:aminoglycoside phosphotransferase (APT) family kinase protein
MSEGNSGFERLVQKIYPGSKLLRAWELKGGVSAQVTALEIAQPNGQIQKLVVRQHGEIDRAANLNIAADEFRLLRTLHRAGIPVPQPYHVEPIGELFDIPALVIEFIEGASDFEPSDLRAFVRQCAEQLAKIHRVDLATYDLDFLPSQEKRTNEKLRQRPAKLDESLQEGRIRDKLEMLSPLTSANKTALLHGDFWPGNLMWHEGRLAAVIDWEDAKLGDPLSDLANSRLEMLWAFDSMVMDDFTAAYRAQTDINFANLPYWDLVAALRPANRIGEWAGDAAKEQKMRERHALFVAQAFESLH